MATLPQPIKKRYPQNARLGIKSSLSSLKRVVSLVYLLYLANDRKSKIDYSEEYLDGATTKIRLKDAYKAFVSAIFAAGEADGAIAANPLITSQLEPLQVGLELVFQLGKINFVAKKASSAERTGGSRFAKTITFSKNIVFIDVYFSALPEDKRKKVLASWMKNEESGTDADAALYQMLTAFTENLKMSVDDGAVNRTFEQEGLYKELLAGNNVIGKDAHEDVGPLRIYKSFVKEGMHPYVQFQSNEFASKVDNDKLSNYLSLVSTALDLMISEIPEEILAEADPETQNNSSQMIYYGCPGTGKSHQVKELTEGLKGEKTIKFEDGTTNVFRTTFHPDYDYATFVGCYKPVKEDGVLDYKFVPQVFTNAYVAAKKNPETPIYLIIEEINRGNCAQIFGDLFQLLDRENGVSKFPINAEEELMKYLRDDAELEDYIKIALPANFNIYATMNTSDQSLFPMDSAFKRRWEMKYIKIDYDNKDADYTFKVNGADYHWLEYLPCINDKITLATDSEDKQMGEFFIRSNMTATEFKNKVMFYLWNDVCKDLYSGKNSPQSFFFRDLYGNPFKFTELFNELPEDASEEDKKDPRKNGDLLLEGFLYYVKNGKKKAPKTEAITEQPVEESEDESEQTAE